MADIQLVRVSPIAFYNVPEKHVQSKKGTMCSSNTPSLLTCHTCWVYQPSPRWNNLAQKSVCA